MRRRKGKTKRKKRLPLSLRILLVLAFFVGSALFLHAFWSESVGGASGDPGTLSLPGEGRESLRLTFLDVGQGDAVLVQCGEDAMLVDAGEQTCGERVAGRLSELGVTKLRYLVMSHPHGDHIGGMEAVASAFEVQTCLSPVETWDYYPFERLKAMFGERFLVPEAGRELALGESTVTVLGPPATGGDLSLNNQSLVLRVDFLDVSVFLTGDMEYIEEAMILSSAREEGREILPEEGRRVLLKCGHHGGSTSTSWAFLQALRPEEAVISCGAGNDYGHPSGTVLRKLGDMGAAVYRTDLQGEIRIEVSASGIRTETDRAASRGALMTPGTMPEEGKTAPESAGTQAAAGQEGYTYVLNNSSGRFHRPGCEYAEKISAKNRDYSMETREELIRQGYAPCGYCSP